LLHCGTVDTRTTVRNSTRFQSRTTTKSPRLCTTYYHRTPYYAFSAKSTVIRSTASAVESSPTHTHTRSNKAPETPTRCRIPNPTTRSTTEKQSKTTRYQSSWPTHFNCAVQSKKWPCNSSTPSTHGQSTTTHVITTTHVLETTPATPVLNTLRRSTEEQAWVKSVTKQQN
jgi:hypothetical protein